MTEQWTKWEPIDGLSKQYILESSVDDLERLELILVSSDNQNKKVQVTFTYPQIYRCTKRIFLKNDLDQEKWTFFKVSNSIYVQLMSEESLTISDYMNFKHFLFSTEEVVFDILAQCEPKIEFITTSGEPI